MTSEQERMLREIEAMLGDSDFMTKAGAPAAAIMALTTAHVTMMIALVEELERLREAIHVLSVADERSGGIN
jgi:hypothetical protein